MKHLKRVTASIAFALLVMTGCKKETRPDGVTAPVRSQIETNTTAKQATVSAALKAKLTKLRATLPAGYEKRLKLNGAFLQKTDPQYQKLVRQVLAIEPTSCDANTPLNQWLNKQLADWTDDMFFYASITGMFVFPTYDALLFENSSANQYFGVNGEFTHLETKTFKDLKRFWDIQSSSMVLVAMHGSMLQDRDRLIRIDMVLYGDSQSTAEYWADLILTLLDAVPQYRNGDHPIFTFNAFAQPSFDFQPYGVIPNKIVLGDGILEAYEAIGYGDVAPQAILAHEFGHQVQFQRNVFGAENSPEATRRTELMADALAAYYLSHARGAAMQWKRVKEFLQVFFNTGDCAFTSTNHHGTPTQRMAAAEWGYHLADNAQKQGHILPASTVIQLFDAALPSIVAN